MQLQVINNSDIRSFTEAEFVAAISDPLISPMSTWSTLNALTGGLSDPSKMPCHSWSISAKICRTGSKLRKIKGSVCSSCYALKGRYIFKNVETAMQRRLNALRSDPIKWAAGIVASIRKTGDTHFRWHDSGDLLGVNHFRLICLIAKYMPDVQFWIPTREKQYIRGEIPSNIAVRVSAAMVGDTIDTGSYLTSSVSSGVGFKCPSSTQDNKCGDCRACWSSVANIDYVAH